MAEIGKNKNLLDHSVVKIINGYLVDYFIFIVIYIVLIMFAIGYFYVLSPKYDSIIKNNELYQSYKMKEIDQLTWSIVNYQNYKNIYNALSNEDKDKVNGFLPSKNDSEELLIYIRNMMTRGGYKLLSLDVDSLAKKGAGATNAATVIANGSMIKKVDESPADNKATSTNRLSAIDISLEIGGLNYSSLKNLLYFIERDARFFDIDSVDFSLSSGIAELEMRAYYLK